MLRCTLTEPSTRGRNLPPSVPIMTSVQTTYTMRKIERLMNAAITANKDWKLDNTEVIYCSADDTSVVKLYGHIIAIIGDTWMQIFDGGHQTNTTKSRLNALLSAHGIGSESVFQKNYTWFFRDAEGGTLPFFSGMRLN